MLSVTGVATKNGRTRQRMPIFVPVVQEVRVRVFFVLLFLFTVGSGLLLSACGSNNAAVITSISITPASATVSPGSQLELTATVNVTNLTTSTNTVVSWEVNGTVGGNASVGTIVPSSSDNHVGIYTAPAAVPSTGNGQVDVTAVAQQVTTTTNTSGSGGSTIASNTSVVTIGVGQAGFGIGPSVSSVPAGGAIQFSATLNFAADPNAAWSVSSPNGGNAGTIVAQTGLYTAPLSPPPGGSVTITGQDGANSASEVLVITYSDHSLSGPYAFSYTGNDRLGYFSVAGSFVADGDGNIESGLEDIESFTTGVSTEVPISGTYTVGPDGRSAAVLGNGASWRFALATNQHALLIRFDANNAGSGMIDQQNLNDLTALPSVISGPYVFGVSGTDVNFSPLGIAGKFSSDGAGQIAVGNTILDVNDGGSVTASDRTLAGSYSFDTAFPGTGRGVLTLTSSATGQRQYAFYLVDNTHFHLVEIDHNAFVSGNAFAAPAGVSFSPASLAGGNYVFTSGGNSSEGAYSAGGEFTSDGAGDAASGVFDSNNAGTISLDAVIDSCPYTVDSSTGRIDLKLCLSGAAREFAMYQTSQGPAVMLELDPTAISTGLAYPQQVSSGAPAGSFALMLAAQGMFHNSPASYQEDLEGQVNSSVSASTYGNLDINDIGVVFSADPVTSAAIAAPTGANGRGTIVLTAENPPVTYNLIYYLMDDNTALLFDQDSSLILTGILGRQF